MHFRTYNLLHLFRIMKAEKDISALKLLSITILMTVSCVSPSADISQKQLSSLGFDLELALNNKADVAKKSNKSIANRQSRIQNLIKSGRENEVVKKLPFNHSPVAIQLSAQLFELPLLNSITLRHQNYLKEPHILLGCPSRAGPVLS